jgi:hypothetical protein
MKNYQFEDLKNYRIMVLGVPGSGKTVFLASMYARLSVQGNDTGFFLKADDREQGRQLAQIYTTVADPTPDKWPRGTQLGDKTDWHFTCCVDGANPSVNYESLHFTYFDYPGEFITEEQEQAFSETFNTMLQSADVFLGILDGQKILAFIGDKPEGDRLLSDLRFILPLMEHYKKPIHFIITKWDLLDGNYSLRDILGKLEKIDAFTNLTQRRARHMPIRIIPVSSVGIGFAELRPDGVMQKKKGAIPHPLRVEVPLVCLLPDKFEARLTALQREESRIQTIRPLSTATERMYQAMRGTITLVHWPVYVLSRLLLRQHMAQSERAFFRTIQDLLKNRIEAKRKLAQEKKDSLDLIVDEQAALRHTIDRFLTLTETFEAEFPESLLKAE